MKRLFSAVLLLILLLAGCENVTYDTQTSQTETSQDIYADIQSMVPVVDETSDGTQTFEKQSFVIATDTPTVFIADEENGGRINGAVRDRNDYLYDTYGADIEIKEVTTANITKDIKAALESGTHYSDMISVSARKTVELSKAGLLYNMNLLPEFDLDSGLFDEWLAKSLATNQTLYILPDPTALVYDETYAMFYSKELVSSVTDESLESLVMQGKWTWDRFYEITQNFANSTDMQNGRFGYASYTGGKTLAKMMWVSSGERIVDNTYKNPVEFSMEQQDIVDISRDLKKYYNTNARLALEGNDATDAFESGRLAFVCNRLSYLFALRDGTGKGNEYGFLPMPKYSEEQTRYCGVTDTEGHVLSVPATMEFADEDRRRFVSTVISATCGLGGKTVKNAYVNSLLALYLNDNAETVMIETICDSSTFDFTVVYGESSIEIERPTCGAVADYVDYGSGLTQTIDMFIGSFNNYVNRNFNEPPEE